MKEQTAWGIAGERSAVNRTITSAMLDQMRCSPEHIEVKKGETHGLMEGVPLHLSLPEVGKAMAGIEGVKSVHDLHIWSLSSNRIALSAHVVIADLRCWEVTLAAMQGLLEERFDIEHVTLQPETIPGVSVPLPLPGCQSSRP